MRRSLHSFAIAALFTALFFIRAQPAQAQAIIINDCQGFTRAVRQAKPGEPTNVQVQVSDTHGQPSNGVKVKITNAVSGETTEVATVNGVASFAALSSGVYSLAVVPDGYVLGAIWLGPAAVGATLATSAAILTGVVAGGGVVGVAAGIDAASGGGGGSSSSTPANHPTPPPLPTARPRPTATPCPVCNPDAQPTPINDFFKQQQQQPAQQQAQVEQRVLSPYR